MGSNPTLGRYFSSQVYLNGDGKSDLRSLEGSVDPRACECRGVMPCFSQFLSTSVFPFKDQGGEECIDLLASRTRSLVSSVGRASDLQAEGHGFEYWAQREGYQSVTDKAYNDRSLKSAPLTRRLSLFLVKIMGYSAPRILASENFLKQSYMQIEHSVHHV